MPVLKYVLTTPSAQVTHADLELSVSKSSKALPKPCRYLVDAFVDFNPPCAVW